MQYRGASTLTFSAMFRRDTVPDLHPADHHEVIGGDDHVPAARCGDGTEGALLPFRGARSTVAAVTDEDAGAGLACLESEEDRTGLTAAL